MHVRLRERVPDRAPFDQESFMLVLPMSKTTIAMRVRFSARERWLSQRETSCSGPCSPVLCRSTGTRRYATEAACHWMRYDDLHLPASVSILCVAVSMPSSVMMVWMRSSGQRMRLAAAAELAAVGQHDGLLGLAHQLLLGADQQRIGLHAGRAG